MLLILLLVLARGPARLLKLSEAEVTAAAPAGLPTQVDYSTYFTSSQAWLGTVISWLSW